MPAPYGQRPDPYHGARLLLGLIPEDVRKSASAAELNGRLTEARRLAAQANDIQLDPLLRSQARAMAQEVLAAPRAAAARAIAKAGRGSGEKTSMQAVFDQGGQLIGVVDPAKIQPVAGHGRAAGQAPQDQDQAPAPAAAAGQVAKGDAQLVAQVLKSLGPKKYLPVHDWLGKPVGIVKRKHVTALPAGQVLKSAAAANVANIYDARRRRLGTAPLAAITPVAELREFRARGRGR